MEIIFPALGYLIFGIACIVILAKHSYRAKHGLLPYDYAPGHKPVPVPRDDGGIRWVDPVTHGECVGYSPSRDKGDVIERRNRAIVWTASAVAFHEAVKHIPYSSPPKPFNDIWNIPPKPQA